MRDEYRTSRKPLWDEAVKHWKRSLLVLVGLIVFFAVVYFVAGTIR